LKTSGNDKFVEKMKEIDKEADSDIVQKKIMDFAQHIAGNYKTCREQQIRY
jgi:hypothetical protein